MFGNYEVNDLESFLRTLGYKPKHCTKIPIEIFPLMDDGSIDIEKTEAICQQRIDSVGISKNEYSELFVVDFSPSKNSDEIEKMILALEKYKKMTEVKEETPIHSLFAANQCPKCGANLGGKLIDGAFYENPYFETCPECGVRLKKLPWQH